ncbi:hypothetical protein RBB77_21520 [Tunturibacter psychrotolerans]|uniref:Anaphase-promoting complex subunit 4 WD40 domain-containing protein n=1 Tax=Tunturiibacter psychrotolerans TaxID=3069686 RepID=A0AAU7ZPT9_9BACT
MSTSPTLDETLHSPFPGLRSFSQNESELFFGREGQSDELARKLSQSRFVAVVGTSGSGKSSLVRAGLLPSLEGGCLVEAGSNWRIVDMRPGSRPIDNLAAALDLAHLSNTSIDVDVLRSSSLSLSDFVSKIYERKEGLDFRENLLILVDQFEELFRYKSRNGDMEDRDEKAAFVKLLLEVSRQRSAPVYVVITIRSDFLGDCARFRDLPETINVGQYLIPRMTREQRRKAIEGPIHIAGSAITPRLVQRILNDVGEDPDQLPVMQHALMRTWYHWLSQGNVERPVDIEDYEAIGTLQNALSSHADEAYLEATAKMPEHGGRITKRIFQRLREKDPSGREIRRPTSLHELCAVSDASMEEVLSVLECFRREGRSFLMPPMTTDLHDIREVDITHESLLRQWKRLQGPPSEDSGWLADEEESRRTMMRLAAWAEQPVQGDPDYLRGPLLQLSLDWWDKRKPNETWAERYTQSFSDALNFLRASEENRINEIGREEERQRSEAKTRREQSLRDEELRAKQLKARRFRLISIAALIGFALMSLIAIYAFVERQQAKKAEFQAKQAEFQAKQAEVQEEKLNGLLNGKIADLAFETSRAEAEKKRADENAAQATREKRAAIAARTSAQALNRLRDQPDLAFLLAVEASREGEAPEIRSGLLTELQSVPNLLTLLNDQAPIVDMAFRGNTLISVDTGGKISTRDDDGSSSGELALKLGSGTPLRLFPERGLLFTYGQLLGDQSGISAPLRVWDTTTSEPVHLIPPTSLRAGSLLAFSGNSEVLVQSSSDGHAKIFDLTGKKEGGVSLSIGAHITAIALSHDGKILATADGDTVGLWDLHDMSRKTLPAAATSRIELLEFSANSKFLAAASYDSSTIWYWNITSSAPTLQTVSQNAQISRLTFNHDATLLASGNTSGYVGIWNIANKQQIWQEQAHSSRVTRIAFSADDKTLASAAGSQIALWSVDRQDLNKVISSASRSLMRTETVFTPTGRLVVSELENNRKLTPGQIPGNIPTGGKVEIRSWDSPNFGELQTSIWKDSDWDRIIVSSDGQTVAAVKFLEPLKYSCPKSEFRLFNAKGGIPLLDKPIAIDQMVTSMAFSPDSQEIVIATCRSTAPESRTMSNQFEIVRWDLRNHRNEGITLHAEAPATALAISPDNRTLLAATGADAIPAKILMWNSESLSPLHLDPGADEISNLNFSPDGEKFAAGSTEGDVILMNVRKRSQLWRVDDLNSVSDLAFSPNGNTLAAGGRGGEITLFDVESGRLLGTLGGSKNFNFNTTSVAFNPKDGGIVATSSGGIVTIWNVSFAAWRKLACHLANRNLSLAEWQQYREGPYQKTCLDLPVHPSLMQAARDLARKGDSEGALAAFRRVQELDPQINIDPKREVAKERMAALADATVIRGTLLSQAQPLVALRAFQEALQLYPSIQISANAWNNICWNGSLQGFAEQVMVACKNALEIEPENLNDRDSRALARALVGDTRGAILDFQACITGSDSPTYREQRGNWVKALQAGQNPFTPEVLQKLRGNDVPIRP